MFVHCTYFKVKQATFNVVFSVFFLSMFSLVVFFLFCINFIVYSTQHRCFLSAARSRNDIVTFTCASTVCILNRPIFFSLLLFLFCQFFSSLVCNAFRERSSIVCRKCICRRFTSTIEFKNRLSTVCFSQSFSLLFFSYFFFFWFEEEKQIECNFCV